MNQIKLFGFTFGKQEENVASPVLRDDDASIKVESAPGFISPHINSISLDNNAATENEYITKYRDISMIPEVNQCVEEIVSESVIQDTDDLYVTLNMDKLEFSESIKKKIEAEFETVYNILLFSRKGHDIFRRWYIDGRLNYQVLIDNENSKQGIQGLRYIDPRKIKKVREAIKAIDKDSQTEVIVDYKTYFIYNDKGVGSLVQSQKNMSAPGTHAQSQDIVMTDESVVYVTSGLTDPLYGFTISYLHHALRASNNLRMMEDSALIYKLVRAPERRVFYIDTGNLPKAKAAQYVQEIADKNKTKVVYDVSTGEIRNDKKFMAMTEDYWIPRKEGSRGTEIETLPGGDSVGEMTEAEYFKDKLYTALNVPKSRFSDQPTLFSGGTQITRDEIRFSRFINQLRTKFSALFEELLGRQVVLKGIMSKEDWDDIKVRIDYEFAEDSYFAEALKSEKLQQQAAILAQFDPFVGKYVSREFVYKDILGMTDEEAKEQMKQIENDAEWHEAHRILENPDLVTPTEPTPQTEDVTKSSDPILIESLLEIGASELELNKALTDFVKNT